MTELGEPNMHNACPYPPSKYSPKRQTKPSVKKTENSNLWKYLPKIRYLLVALFVAAFFSILVYAWKPSQVYVFVDDVSLNVDGKLLYVNDFSWSNTYLLEVEDPGSIQFTGSNFRSSPYSIGFNSVPTFSSDIDAPALKLVKRVSDWGTINATWYGKINTGFGATQIFNAYFGSQVLNGTLSSHYGSNFEAVIQSYSYDPQDLRLVYIGFRNSEFNETPGYWTNIHGPAFISEQLLRSWDSDRWYKFSLVFSRAENVACFYIDNDLVVSMSLSKCKYGTLEGIGWIGFKQNT